MGSGTTLSHCLIHRLGVTGSIASQVEHVFAEGACSRRSASTSESLTSSQVTQIDHIRSGCASMLMYSLRLG